jgi:hypothetical protein
MNKGIDSYWTVLASLTRHARLLDCSKHPPRPESFLELLAAAANIRACSRAAVSGLRTPG